MTKTIITDLIKRYPEIIKSGKLVICSDNCSTQYKSLYVFQDLLDLSIKHNIQITWFYGEAGHGRGLIDAMAWFGCKGPLRHAIFSKDCWFSTAGDMSEYLTTHFSAKNDYNKKFHLVNPEVTAKIRSLGKTGHPIKGSSSSHIISIKDGMAIQRSVLDGSDEMFALDFHHINNNISDSSDSKYRDELTENQGKTNDETSIDLYSSALETLVKIGSVIALYTPSNNVLDLL